MLCLLGGVHAEGAARVAWTNHLVLPARCATCHAAKRKKQSAGRGFGGRSSSGGVQEAATNSGDADAGAQPVVTPHTDAASGRTATAPHQAALPKVSRGKVFQTCATISGAMLGGGLLLRQAAPYTSAALGADTAALQALLAGPQLLDSQHLAIMLTTAASITATRQALLAVWPDFAAATDASNRQVLSPLAPYDLLWVAALPGISEEVLFRGALIPALSPDWRGVLLAGAAFGVLHNSGGRNWAFAAWAAAVGSVYGAVYLLTGDIAVPAGAHSLANLAGAVLWLQFRKTSK